MKKQYQDKVDLIESRRGVWRERMGLDHFEIEHHYIDAPSDMFLGAHPKQRPGVVRCGFGVVGEHGFTACVETRWNYQMADVYFLLPSCVQHTDKRIDQIIVHEYTHILQAPEQYLLEVKLSEIASSEEMTTEDFGLMATLYYERMEMATESASRAIYRGWADE